MSQKPKISVLIPVYNGGVYLKKLIENLQNQTLKDFEVICVEDSSTDDSMEFLQDKAKNDNRIKVIHRHIKGGTAIKGIVYGIPYCSGEYFFYLSQDDLIDNDCFEKLYSKAIETNADIVVSDVVWFYDDGKDHGGIYAPNEDYNQEMSGKEAFLQSLDWRIGGYTLQKMDFAKKIGWDDKYYNSCEYGTRTHFLYANKVVFSNAKSYYRQNNLNAITKTAIKPFKMETMLTDIRLVELMINNKLIGEPEFKMAVLRVKSALKYYLSFKVYNSFSKEDKKQVDRIIKKVKFEYLKQLFRSKKLNYILIGLRTLFLYKQKLSLKNYLRYKIYLKQKNKKYYSCSKKAKRKRFFVLYNKLLKKQLIEYDKEIAYMEKIEEAKNLPCKVGRCTYCGDNVFVGHPETKIGNFCSLAGNINIGPGEHPLNYLSTSSFFYLDLIGWNENYRESYIEPCQIGNDVWIGCNVFIKSGIKIGDGAVIGAGAVVVNDVPPYAVVGGVPAKIIKYRFDDDIIKDFLELKWWYLDDEIIKTLPFKDPKECIKKLKEIRKSE